MSVLVEGCPIVFHDAQELLQFLLHCGKYVYMFDGARCFSDSRYLFTLRIYYSIASFRECISYQIERLPHGVKEGQ